MTMMNLALARYIEMALVFFYSELFRSMGMLLWGKVTLQE